VTGVEWIAAALLAVGGLRSLWVWSHRPFEGVDAADHVLFALFVTGRVGLWFAFAGLAAIYGSSDAQGRAFIDEASQYRWYVIVLILLSALQFVGSQLLARRTPRRRPPPSPPRAVGEDEP
jgi:hypothetical protein